MRRHNDRLKKMQTISRQWGAKIENLEAQADSMEGREHLTTIELLNHMKQQKMIVDQYLSLVRKQGDGAWRKNASELQHMLQDIDATYRRVMAYFN